MNTRTFLRICAAAIPGTILFPRALFAQTPKVMLGIDVLESRKFAPIAWKKGNNAPVDVPVLPELTGDIRTLSLTPYADTPVRIALFPRGDKA